MVCDTCCSRLQSGIHRRIIARRIKKVVVVFNTMVEIPFNNREELVWYATPVALEKSRTYKRMKPRRIKKIVVVFDTMVEIPFYNREELVWYATPVAHDRNLL
jgi:hypothetical protein